MALSEPQQGATEPEQVPAAEPEESSPEWWRGLPRWAGLGLLVGFILLGGFLAWLGWSSRSLMSWLLAEWMGAVAVAPFFGAWWNEPRRSLALSLFPLVVLGAPLVLFSPFMSAGVADPGVLLEIQLYLLATTLLVWSLTRLLLSAFRSGAAAQLAAVGLVAFGALGLHTTPLVLPWLESDPWILTWLVHGAPEVVLGAALGFDVLHLQEVYLGIPLVADYPYAYPSPLELSWHCLGGAAATFVFAQILCRFRGSRA